MVTVNGNLPLSLASLKSAKVSLVPWDPESTQHAGRLYDQRVACGWKQEKIESWRALQREGKMAIHWVVGGSPASLNPDTALDGARLRIIGVIPLTST
jgi:hypothetical protein